MRGCAGPSPARAARGRARQHAANRGGEEPPTTSHRGISRNRSTPRSPSCRLSRRVRPLNERASAAERFRLFRTGCPARPRPTSGCSRGARAPAPRRRAARGSPLVVRHLVDPRRDRDHGEPVLRAGPRESDRLLVRHALDVEPARDPILAQDRGHAVVDGGERAVGVRRHDRGGVDLPRRRGRRTFPTGPPSASGRPRPCGSGRAPSSGLAPHS